MTGRGIDQILPCPGSPVLHERHIQDARRYVDLAEAAHGSIRRPVDFAYIWGDSLEQLERVAPDARIVNLETSVTSSEDAWPDKEVHYRMHPQNLRAITAAAIDCCCLANNHIMDWGYAGLDETLRALDAAGIRHAGAGPTMAEAMTPAILHIPGKGRVLLFSVGSTTSGIPDEWAASATRAGVNLLPDLSVSTARTIGRQVRLHRRAGDVIVISIHWGSNWGYAVPDSHVRFASRLLHGEVDIVHGHSSHHPRPIHIINGKLALFGCGECINDYEGIGGYEAFRGDLVLMYCPTIDPDTGTLARLRIRPMQIRRMQLTHASESDARWLEERLARISQV